MRKFFLMMSVCLVSTLVSAQKASTKTVDETCNCVKKINKKQTEDQRLEDAINCMANAMVANMDALKKEYKVKTTDPEAAANEVGEKLGAQIAKDCPEMTPYFIQLAKQSQEGEAGEADINPDTLKLDSKVCEKFKAGKYSTGRIFMSNKELPNDDKTSYSEVKDGFVYDYSDNKKNVTKWSIRWISPCQWEQTLVESNDPNIKTAFKKGEKIVLKALGSSGDSGLWVSTTMMGMDFIMLLKKIK